MVMAPDPEAFPIVVLALPELFARIVPTIVVAAKVEVPVTPTVLLKVAAPVTASVVPTAREEPEVMEVVEVIDPGAVKAEGMEKVTVEPADVAVISLEVPARVIFPPVGSKLLIVLTDPLPAPIDVQVAELAVLPVIM